MSTAQPDTPDMPRYLNLGCGGVYAANERWRNMDVAPANTAHVHQYQLLMGIPCADAGFDAVYHSHMLEHFPRGMALPFLRECLRVLRPGGILRVVVPDLERILRGYLAALDAARRGEDNAQDALTWMQVELLDQLTRTRSGGLMAPAWRHADAALASFIRERVGGELDGIARHPQPAPLNLPEAPLGQPHVDERFLNGGERHCWMYESESLRRLLEQAGFVGIRVTGCHTGAFAGDQPDCRSDGTARKPDSLYMEAQRPAMPLAQGPRVALFSATDRGGAGIAAMRLAQGLRERQASSVTYVQYKLGLQPQVYVLPPDREDRVVPYRGGFALASLDRNLELQKRALAPYAARPGHYEMFSASSATTRLARSPGPDEADILHFHWVARFLDIPADVPFLKRRQLVWTLHDMNPFTGGCHYAAGCDGYLHGCEHCPQLGAGGDLAHQTWKRRNYAYGALRMSVVAPSRWLAGLATASPLMGRFDVRCIPNGLPLDIFAPGDRHLARRRLRIPEEARALLFSADNLLNQRKGLNFLLEALNELRRQGQTDNLVLLLLGNGGRRLSDMGFQVIHLGSLGEPAELALAYTAADAVALPSLEDNLPNVLTEALACGTPGVAFAVGGIPEILDHGHSGWLAQPRHVGDLARGLQWALTPDPLRRRLCRATAMERYSLTRCADAYMALYAELMERAARTHGQDRNTP